VVHASPEKKVKFELNSEIMDLNKELKGLSYSRNNKEVKDIN